MVLWILGFGLGFCGWEMAKLTSKDFIAILLLLVHIIYDYVHCTTRLLHIDFAPPLLFQCASRLSAPQESVLLLALLPVSKLCFGGTALITDLSITRSRSESQTLQILHRSSHRSSADTIMLGVARRALPNSLRRSLLTPPRTRPNYTLLGLRAMATTHSSLTPVHTSGTLSVRRTRILLIGFACMQVPQQLWDPTLRLSRSATCSSAPARSVSTQL